MNYDITLLDLLVETERFVRFICMVLSIIYVMLRQLSLS